MKSPAKDNLGPLKGGVEKPRHVGKRVSAAKGWSDFSGYMGEKTRKLREKFAAEFKSSESSADEKNKTGGGVLTGVTVWVDGYTRPGREELRCIIGENGGFFEVYPTGRVTHIVAESLAAATRLRLKKNENGRRKVRVVTPKWVVESVEKGRRLPEAEFSVKGMTDPGQKSIGSFFKKKSR